MKLDRPVLVIGSGGHAKVVIGLLKAIEADIVGCISPESGKSVLGVRIVGNDGYLDKIDRGAVLLANGIGSVRPGGRRASIFDELGTRGFQFATLVHPTAFLADEVMLEQGAQIMAGAILQPSVRVRANAVINTKAGVDHDCDIGRHAQIAPGAALSGSITVCDDAHVGVGACIREGLRIGRGALVGAGAAVVADVADGATVVGVPAREIA